MPDKKPSPPKYTTPHPNPVEDFRLENFLKKYDYNWPTLRQEVIEDEADDGDDLSVDIETPRLDTDSKLPAYGENFTAQIPFDKFDKVLAEACDNIYVNMAAAAPGYYENRERTWFENILSRSRQGTHKVVEKRSIQSYDNAVYKPANMSLPFDPSGGLGVTLPVPVSLTDVIVHVLKYTEKKSRYLENLLLSSPSKSLLSKLFWAVLIQFYRVESDNPFNPQSNRANRDTLEKLIDQLAWEYANFQERFKTDNIFMVYAVLAAQVLFTLFHHSFPTETFGINFLIGLNIVIFEWLCGLRPRLDLLKMYPMEKLCGGELKETDTPPAGCAKVLRANFPKGDYKNNTGNGTIVLGMMSGLLNRYCQRTQSGGVGQIIGVLTKRHIQRSLI